MLTKSILKNAGFSLIELLIVIAVTLVLFSFVIYNIHPAEQKQKARDQRRLADAIRYQEAIEEFKADNKVYPDVFGEVRVSNILPPSSTNISVSSSGWILEDLSSYLDFLPTDPINKDEYVYKYVRNDTDFEFNIKLEYYLDKMSSDGGNDDFLYEIGDDLTLL